MKRLESVAVLLALVAAAAAGSGMYVLLTRLSTEVLAVLATVGCAAGVALPSLLVALVVVLRRPESGQRAPAPQMTQPMMMVVPPMALPQTPQYQAPATWHQAPARREFTVVGDE